LIYAMFQHGFSQTAKEKWLEIIQKNVDNRGFFEWDNKEGVGLGSDFYAGSAGSMGKALFEGYFGINLRHNHLSIEPKLGKESGNIYVYQPANDVFVEYEYTFGEKESLLSIKYNSNYNHTGMMRILSPWSNRENSEGNPSKNVIVRIDGKVVNSYLETRNSEQFIIFETDFNNHVADISIE